MADFSLSEAIRYGWGQMRNNCWFFFGFNFIWVVCFAAIQVLEYLGNNHHAWTVHLSNKGSLSGEVIFVALILVLLRLGVQGILSMGFVKTALAISGGGTGKYSDLFCCYPLVFKFFLAETLLGIISALVSLPIVIFIIIATVFSGSKLALLLFIAVLMAGLLFFAVSVGIRISFFVYCIVDKECGPLDAMILSAAITKGQVWNLFLLYSLLVMINIAGLLCLLLGWLATVPLAMMTRAFTYRWLLDRWEEKGRADSPIGVAQPEA